MKNEEKKYLIHVEILVFSFLFVAAHQFWANTLLIFHWVERLLKSKNQVQKISEEFCSIKSKYT